MEKLLKIFLDRIHRWGEVAELLNTDEYDYLFDKPALKKEKICWKNQTPENARENLKKVSEILNDKEKIMRYANEAGKGNVLWPLRYTLSGKEKSPDPFTLIDILGIEESKNRIQNAIQLL